MTKPFVGVVMGADSELSQALRAERATLPNGLRA